MKTHPFHLVAIAGLAASLPANAAVFAREDFNYANGNLAGSNGGFGWSAAWTNAQGTPTVSASKGILNSVAGQQGARLISALQEPPVGGSKEVWIAFEGKQSTTLSGTTNSYGGLGLYKGNTDRVLIGKSWPGEYVWKAGTGAGLVGSAVPVSTLATTFVVARINMVDGTASANDTLEVWLNPADTSSVVALGAPQITRSDADLSFDTLRIRSGSGAGGTEGWEFDAVAAGDTLADVVAADSDSDGMLDSWETTYGLVVGVNDSAGDLDVDGATNLQEFQRDSLPNNVDTDGDNLLDGVETKTGVWASTADRGTDPTKLDSDGDGFLDDQEINSGVFTDFNDPGTNPNLADSDNDGHWDLFEVERGSDPNNILSVPATGDLTVIGSDNFDSYPDEAVGGQTGGSGFDFDNSPFNNVFIGHGGSPADWDALFGAPTISGGKMLTLASGAKREFNGPGEGGAVNSDEYNGAVKADTAAKVVYLRADLTRSAGTTWSGVSVYDFGTERLFFGVPSEAGPSGFGEFAIQQTGVGTTFRETNPILPNDGQAYTVVCKVDYVNQLLSLWVNPDLTKTEEENTPYVTRPYTGTAWTTAMRLASGGTEPTSWDSSVAALEWSALGVFTGQVADDYLDWIGGYTGAAGAPGFDQDADQDGVSNGIEHVLGSDPTASSAGLTQLSSTATSATFRHSLTNSLAIDASFTYEWSTDLTEWKLSDVPNAGGVTVTIAPSVTTDNAAPQNDEIEVIGTVTTGTTPKLFLRLAATAN